MNEASSAVAERVHELLASVVESAGADLLDVEWTGGTLRLTIDHAEGISTGTLTKVNRLVSPILDQHDPIAGRYVLEVSSPGVERPLRTETHFQRAVGESVVVKLHAGEDPRRIRGALKTVTPEVVTVEAVEIDGMDLAKPEVFEIELAMIEKARTHFDWGPTPKKGGKATTGKPKGGKGSKGKKGGVSGGKKKGSKR